MNSHHDADELLHQFGPDALQWRGEEVSTPDGVAILASVAEAVEAVDVVDDKAAERRERLAPLISFYGRPEQVAAVAASMVERGSEIEALVMRIGLAATGTVADGLRKALREASTKQAERALRIVGPDEGPPEIRAVLRWSEYPEGVVVPSGWTLTPDLLSQVRVTKFGPAIERVGSPVLMTRRIVDVDSGSWAVELAWRVGGRWTRERVPREEAMDSRALVRMAGRGLPISSSTSRLLVAWLTALDQQDAMPVDHGTVRMGWVGRRSRYFMLGSRCYYSGEKPSHRVDLVTGSAGAIQLAEAITTRGTWDGWLRTVALVADYPAMWLAVYAATSAPLIRILHARNFGVDFAGQSGSGKSTALELAASCFGSPLPGGVSRTWGGTLAGAEGTVGTLCDLPMCLDEGQLVPPGKRAEAGALLHTIIDGAGRAKGTLGRLGLGQVDSWRTVVVSTSEDGITGWAAHDGVKRRMLEIREIVLGSRSVTQAHLAEAVQDGCRENYGHLMQRLIQHLVDASEADRDILRRGYKARIDQLAETAGTPMVRSAARYMATLDCAAMLVHQVLGVPRPTCDVSGWIWARIQESHGGGDRAEAAIRAAWSWIWAHESDFKGRGRSSQPVGGWLGEWDFRPGVLAVSPLAMDRLLRELGHSDPTSIYREWIARGWARANKGSTYLRSGKNSKKRFVALVCEGEDGSGGTIPFGDDGF